MRGIKRRHYHHAKKLKSKVERIEQNGLEQAFALRRYYFPNEDDDEQNLARALWLEKHERERMEIAVGTAIAKLFKR
ncbi:DUF6890 family protein [Vibrio sp. V19_P1S1T109]|uniref:DUF6890 family protein n=1 Tax=Vibrio sp. V19_P1S1T109 TaxID=1938672 RepID=UPI003F8F35F2